MSKDSITEKQKNYINIVIYSVTVKENGDSFHSSDSRRVIKWANEYENHCLNQDEPWQPHFEFTKEEMN